MPKFSLRRVKAALKSTARFSKADDNNVTMSGYLLRYSNNGDLDIACANGESWHMRSVPAEEGFERETWAIVVGAKALSDMIDAIPGNVVEIKHEIRGGKPRIRVHSGQISGGRTNWSLVGLPADLFPALNFQADLSIIIGGPEEMGEEGKGEGARDFARMIRAVTFVAHDAPDEAVPIYRVVRFESNYRAGGNPANSVVRLTALDGRRYAQAWGHLFTSGRLPSMIVPAKFLADVGRSIDDSAPVSVGVRLINTEAVAIVIQNGSQTWVSTLVEAAYPNTEEITPVFLREVVVYSGDLRALVKHLDALSALADNVAVLRISKTGIVGRAVAPETGETHIEIDNVSFVDGRGDDSPMTIALSMKLLGGILAANPQAEMLTLKFSGPESGVMLSDTGMSNWRVFMMPVTLGKARMLGLPTKEAEWLPS